MTDRQPDDPTDTDFHKSAERSQEAGIADESAAYVNAGGADAARDEKAVDEESTENKPKPSDGGRPSESPAEGDDAIAPRQHGSPS